VYLIELNTNCFSHNLAISYQQPATS